MAAAAYDIAMDYMYKYAPGIADHLVIENATTTQNQLYGDINLASLNWFERTWANYYIFMGNAILATGVMSFLLHEASINWWRQHRLLLTCWPADCLLWTCYSVAHH